MGFTVKEGPEKGSEKGFSMRCLERPLEEYPPLGVRPNQKCGEGGIGKGVFA